MNKTLQYLAMILCCAAMTSGCATVRELAALRDVDFSIDRLSDAHLAGISLARVRSYSDLGLMDMGRLGMAIASKALPLSFTVHVRAENPPDNRTSARLIGMAWTLFIQDKETISGALEQGIVMPPGEPQDVPVVVNLNLLEFFDSSARDLFDMALSLTGQGGSPKHIRLEILPTIDTALGPMRYPKPISVISRQVGS